MTALPPSGWYPDPEAGGTAWRWWDGSHWSPPPPAGYRQRRPYAGVWRGAPEFIAEKISVAGTSKYGTWLRWAMVGNAACSCLAARSCRPSCFTATACTSRTDDRYGEPQFSGGFLAFQFASIPLSFVSYAYLGYAHRLDLSGREVRRSAWLARERGRTLGAFSVLIPIVQWWWPYEAVRDSYPPGSCPSLVLKWWVCYLVTPILAIPLLSSRSSVGRDRSLGRDRARRVRVVGTGVARLEGDPRRRGDAA